MDIKDLNTEATAATSAFGVAFQLIPGGGHGTKPEIGGLEYAIEHRADRIGLQFEIKRIVAIRQRRDPAKGAGLSFCLVEFAHRVVEAFP